jgi:hypothetical protein
MEEDAFTHRKPRATLVLVYETRDSNERDESFQSLTAEVAAYGHTFNRDHVPTWYLTWYLLPPLVSH